MSFIINVLHFLVLFLNIKIRKWFIFQTWNSKTGSIFEHEKINRLALKELEEQPST
jgi:hypothetical protein